MLSPDDKLRIEAEERYRHQIRKGLGPVETTSFINKLVKFVLKGLVWFYVVVFAVAAISVFVMETAPQN